MRPWIVVPAHDEAATIGRVVAAAARHAPVLVVDDGSADGTADLARAAGAEVLRHPRRLGKGAALRTGLAAARARGATHVVTLDGDGQHVPDDVATLLAAARHAPDAIVVGGRLGEAATSLPRARLNAIRIASFFVSWVAGTRLLDSQSGFRVYPVALLDRLPLRRGGFVFETEILLRAAAAGAGIHEVPVALVPRAARPSRFRPVGDGVAVTAFLTAAVLTRWGAEIAAGLGEVAAVFGPARIRARHRAILAACAGHSVSPGPWALAVGAEVAQRAVTRLREWWDRPRRRRAAAVARASLAAPLVLGLGVLQALGGGRGPDLVTPLVARVFDQRRLVPVPDVQPGRPRRVPGESQSARAPRGALSEV